MQNWSWFVWFRDNTIIVTGLWAITKTFELIFRDLVVDYWYPWLRILLIVLVCTNVYTVYNKDK